MLPIFRHDTDERKHQINTLKIFNDNVSEITENVEYHVKFNSGGNELSLVVTLGKDFPQEKPKIKIIPRILHHWVNAEGEVTSAPGLLNYTVHSDLGRVVQAIIREFQRTPPPLGTNASGNNIMSPSIPIPTLDTEKLNSHNFPNHYNNLNSFSPPAKMPILATRSVVFPELNNLSLNELKILMENEDRQQEFLDEQPYIKERNRILDEQISQVEEIAESNLKMQDQLEELRSGIESRIEEITKLSFETERLHSVYQNLSEKYSPRNIQEQLRLAAVEAEKESDEIAENFLNGQIDVDKFVQQFLRSRALCQNRKTREEKLAHQLDSLERAGF